MLRSQGRYFRAEELQRLIFLLRETELSLGDIAERMGCSKSAVAAINRRHQVREYNGRRTQWVLTT
jgi:DNA-directed RNA polymerase specialized sigma24 family protein